MSLRLSDYRSRFTVGRMAAGVGHGEKSHRRIPFFLELVSKGWLSQMVPLRQMLVGTIRQPGVPLQRQPMFPQASHVGNQSFHISSIHGQGRPCRQLSSGQWALSERLSIELADTDWKYESAPARSRQLHSLRDIQLQPLRIKNALPLSGGCARLPNF